ncbi:hypothetical protein IEU95_06590 [Hoyosella rhizosphaerae]|uniref:Uncharacterized protein n=1 Tax=Hoyosella rhizosphaerae TaxID=1755582 RepID=A0A916XBQ6_9ACTN|nr:hypothetical protein [Hoyosella rhizosphaerae]MBN4926489.1 hypothetical protein [Hoyosella rhizosphaerae]GGC58967.1 hypothetical protein GCM10011410_09230 [Hoyosella rhizosphaerae]
MKRNEVANLAAFLTFAGGLLFQFGALWSDVPSDSEIARRIVLVGCVAILIPAALLVSRHYQRSSARFIGTVYLGFAVTSVTMDIASHRLWEAGLGAIGTAMIFGAAFAFGVPEWINKVTQSPDATGKAYIPAANATAPVATATMVPRTLRRHETINVVVAATLSITAAFMTITRWMEVSRPPDVSLGAHWQSWVLALCFVIITVVSTWSVRNYWRPTVPFISTVYASLGAVAVLGYIVNGRYATAASIIVATPILIMLANYPPARAYLHKKTGSPA